MRIRLNYTTKVIVHEALKDAIEYWPQERWPNAQHYKEAKALCERIGASIDDDQETQRDEDYYAANPENGNAQ